MASNKRGSQIDRVLAFYRESSADVVRVTHQLAGEVMAERGIGSKPKPNNGGATGKRTYTKKSKLASGTSAGGSPSVSGGANE